MTFNSSLLENIPHTVKHYPAKSTLLSAGDCAKHLFFIKSGAVRMWFNKDGKDYTLQFFFEDMPVCSFESFLRGEPSKFSIETIEPSEVLVFSKEEIWKYGDAHPTQKQSVMEYMLDRMINYTHLFLSMQIHTPEQRYDELVKYRPDIIQRIPQHYIASFLGITAVSLSRIRGRK